MKVAINTQVKDFNGAVVEGSDKKPLEVKALVVSALTVLDQKEADLAGDERYQLYKLALKISDCKDDTINLTSDEIVIIKRRVGKMYMPLIVGRVFDVLEGEDAN